MAAGWARGTHQPPRVPRSAAASRAPAKHTAAVTVWMEADQKRSISLSSWIWIWFDRSLGVGSVGVYGTLECTLIDHEDGARRRSRVGENDARPFIVIPRGWRQRPAARANPDTETAVSLSAPPRAQSPRRVFSQSSGVAPECHPKELRFTYIALRWYCALSHIPRDQVPLRALCCA